MSLFKKRHKSDWIQGEIVSNSGIFQQVDVDKHGNPVNPLDTKTIIVGKKNVCTHPDRRYTCRVCGRKITTHHDYFTGKLNLPEYCED